MIARICLLALVLLAGAAAPGVAQETDFSFLEGETLANRSIQLLVLLTVLSLVPGLAVMITCFPFMVTVLAILRQAIGLQQSPPSMLMVSLALFLTYYVMEPVFSEAWARAGAPFTAGDMPVEEAFLEGLQPFRTFMAARLEPDTFARLADLRGTPRDLAPEAPLSLMIPAFMLSEIERAFQIGFLIFLPFLIIDLVVAAVLMSMGMMMVPPVIVSLPFKLAFFVVADGWVLISSALVRGYV